MRALALFTLAAALSAQTPRAPRAPAPSQQPQPTAAGGSQMLGRAEAHWKAGRYQDANTAFRELIKVHPKNAEYRIRWGRFYLERFQPTEAAALFSEALELQPEHPQALLGLALVASESFESKAVELAEKALKADPKLFEARELLARLALEDSDTEKAIAEADKALAISPNALDAMAIRATIDWLADKTETPWLGRILKINPRYGQAHAIAGHFFVINRRYEEGIAAYRKAIALDPALWSARAQLGVNLMRLGFEQEAREHLELCYTNGHKDSPTVNTLRLMDSYKNFQTFKTPASILKLHNKEAAALRPFVESELQRAIEAFEKKYKLSLGRPVQLELYPDHEDFAVRTMGMPGLGALGVTFGYVVAMDSPSGRKPGTFHWASTLWHELSHVFVLAATKHRVPRWFTEGMAVHEETAVSPEWGDRLDPHVLRAIKDKKLLPVATLDRGFVRPNYPMQVIVSYFQAGRICDYINEHWGYDKLLAMMHDYAAGGVTPDVIQRQLGISAAEFDERFLASLEASTKQAVEGFEGWTKQLKQVAEAAREKRPDDVIRQGTAIRDLFPEYIKAGSIYEFLADAHIAKGDKAAATTELERYARAGGRSPQVLKQLSTLLEEAKRPKDAAAALERLNYIQPLDEDLQRRLGSLWIELKDGPRAVRAFEAVLHLRPVDPAASHYNLARAYHLASRNEQAKEQLLLSLEAAPGYRPAQRLLLQLSR